MRLAAILLLVTEVSTFAASKVVLHPMLESAPGTEGAVKATAEFRILRGRKTPRSPERDRFAIAPASRLDEQEHPYIFALFSRLNPNGLATQQGQARADLSTGKDAGPFSSVGSIETARYGKLMIYYFGAKWPYQHFRVYIVEGRIRVEVELVVSNHRELEQYRPALEEVVRSVIIRDNHTKA
jgi:hypothetical protein